MLTQHEIRKQLDTIANEVAQSPGIYYELFARLFSTRVQRWMRSVPRSDALLIQRIADGDPDYLAGVDDSVDIETMPLYQVKQNALFNPAWDMDY